MEETMDFEYEEDFEEENDKGEEGDVGRDGDGDGDGDEDDDEYEFRFKSGVNPLDLTESNASGLQVYQQFERLEYEALASRKRKAIAVTRSNEDVASKGMYEFMEAINYGGFRRRRKSRKLNNPRGRRKGTKNKLSPQIKQLLGEATLHYAHGRFEQAISVLKEVVRVAPNLPDSYQTLGLVYKELGDNRKAFDSHVMAALLTRNDSSLWKQLFAWSVEKGDTAQAKYCLCKAVGADPKDVGLIFHLASFYVELGDYQRAAESYEKIQKLCPEDVEAIKAGAKLYLKCGQLERSMGILEEYLKGHPSEADLSVLDLLLALLMQNNAHEKALRHIEHAHVVYFSGKELPLKLKIKAGICYFHLGNMEKAEIYFAVLQRENAHDHADLFTEVADSFMSLEHYNFALKYYCMLEANAGTDSGYLHLKMAECYLCLKERRQAIKFFYKALGTFENNIDARLTLASLLLEDAREDEATALLSPPNNPDDQNSDKSNLWWRNEKIIMKLCHIYRAKGMPKDFIDAIFPLVRESLCVEALQKKVKVKKRLTRSVLHIRADFCNTKTDSILCGIRPIASKSDLLKASRAKKLLQKKEKLKQEQKALADAAGVDWHSDESDDESPQEVHFDPPLPNLLKDEDHQYIIIDLCKALISLQRYEEASDIIDLSMRLAYIKLPLEKKEQLRALGAQMAYDSTDPKHGFDSAKYILHQHPYSLAAWNCYYKVISRLGKSNSNHGKFLRYIRSKHKDCVPPIIISGHQLTVASHHQDAARDYLEAYRLLPDDPLINLCVGTALINLALGFRLQNKHQCIAQGLAFLYNNLQFCENSQEALYNIGRACHHVGLVSLAATYYEKVLGMKEKDYPIPRDPNKNGDLVGSGYCDLRREAAYNLHLIYKKSGAVDLARQLLKDYCTF